MQAQNVLVEPRTQLQVPTFVTVPVEQYRSAYDRSEVMRVLQKAANDPQFVADLSERGSEALTAFNLTMEEKAALVSGDIGWIEEHVGKLDECECTCLTCMLQREAW